MQYSVENGSLIVEDARTLALGIASGNGAIHAIDTVRVPELLTSLDHYPKSRVATERMS